MSLPRPASPRALLQDLREFARERSRHQWIAAAMAVLMPAIILVLFYYDGKTNIMPGEQLTYINSWSADRSDAEIIAAQKERQAKADEAAKARQEQFKKLEQDLGM